MEDSTATPHPITTFEIFPFPWPPGQEPRPPGESLQERRSSVETLPSEYAPDERRSLTRITDNEDLSDDWQKLQAIAARVLNENWERWLSPTSNPGVVDVGSVFPSGSSSLIHPTSARDNFRTLTNLYNQRPTWFVLAHEKLDCAVFNLYGWEWGLSDEHVLGRLLEENLRRRG